MPAKKTKLSDINRTPHIRETAREIGGDNDRASFGRAFEQVVRASEPTKGTLQIFQKDSENRSVPAQGNEKPVPVELRRGVNVFGLDLSSQMIAQAQQLNPDIEFREGNMLALGLADDALAAIVAFYAIVNIPAESLPVAFAEMHRVLQTGGLLLLSFHIGDDVIRPEELWGNRISMEFYRLQPERIQLLLTNAGFGVENTVEREPYAPDVEFQSRRAYIFARKPTLPV